MGKTHRKTYLIITLLIILLLPMNVCAEDGMDVEFHAKRDTQLNLKNNENNLQRFIINAPYQFKYPDAVRGIYVSGKSAGSKRFHQLVNLVDSTELNAMVIDMKDDYGNLTFIPKGKTEYTKIAKNDISDPQKMMKILESKQIYPIARIVVFKDTVLAHSRADLSFTQKDQIWKNNRGEAFVNPFMKEVWEYNVDIAKMAAEMGFQEIQFDYVRFPEGFEKMDQILEYEVGDYSDLEMNNVQKRVEAVSDFVAYANKELEQYDVDVSVDIFGYAATIPEAPGIGQNFSRIAENVDVISSMIYPSHWSNNFFGIDMPDREPYRLVSEYAKVENAVLDALESPPVSRPWLQDFEAPWLYSGKTKQYGKEEVEAQIKALYENNIHEFLLWNAGNVYSENVDYLLNGNKSS